MNIPVVGKPAIGPSLLEDDDDDDVCAVCTADLIHLERERLRADASAAARYGRPQLSQSPSLLPLQSVVKASLPHSDSLFPSYPREGSWLNLI